MPATSTGDTNCVSRLSSTCCPPRALPCASPPHAPHSVLMAALRHNNGPVQAATGWKALCCQKCSRTVSFNGLSVLRTQRTHNRFTSVSTSAASRLFTSSLGPRFVLTPRRRFGRVLSQGLCKLPAIAHHGQVPSIALVANLFCMETVPQALTIAPTTLRDYRSRGAFCGCPVRAAHSACAARAVLAQVQRICDGGS